MIFGRNTRPGVGDTDFYSIRRSRSLAPSLARNRGLAGCTPFPSVRFRMEPDGAALRCELRSVFQKVRYNSLDLGRVDRQRTDLFVCQEIERKASFLKTRRPQAAHFRKGNV